MLKKMLNTMAFISTVTKYKMVLPYVRLKLKLKL